MHQAMYPAQRAALATATAAARPDMSRRPPSPPSRWMRPPGLAWALLVLLLIFCGTAQPAPLRTPEVERGLAWLEARVNVDGSVQGEDSAMAQALQVRCEISTTYVVFSKYPAPSCAPVMSEYSELRSRNGSLLPAEYWLASGAAVAAPDHSNPSAVDTVWAIANRTASLDVARQAAAVAWLLTTQQPSGALQPPGTTDARAFTALAGFALAQRWQDLSLPQRQQVLRAAEWVKARAVAPGDWGSDYLTALAHLFLVNVDADPVRDVAVESRLVAAQRGDGSWQGDPFLTALVVRALGARSSPVSNTSTLTLRVIDAQTGRPLPGVGVSGWGKTDDVGRFQFEQAPGANLSVTLSLQGYQSRKVDYVLQPGVVTDLGDIALEPLSGSAVVFGVVRDAVTGALLGNVNMRDAPNGVNITTDAGGSYSVTLPRAARLNLAIEKTGYRGTTASLDVVLGRSYSVDVDLQPQATDLFVRGIVTDAATGAPLQEVQVLWRSGTHVNTTSTRADGSFRLGPLSPGPGVLSLSRWGGYIGVHVSGVIPANPGAEVSVQLQRGALPPTSGSVSGVVKDEVTGQSLAGVELRLVNHATNAEVAVAHSDAHGAFALVGIPFADYRLSADLDGYQGVQARFQLSGSIPQAKADATLRRLIVSGRVVDAMTGAPIAAAMIKLSQHQTTSSVDGRYSFSEVKAGQHDVEVSATGYRTALRTVTIAALGDQDLGDVALDAEVTQAQLGGIVTDLATGTALAGVTVSVDAVRGTHSEADGSWLVAGVELGRRSVRASLPGYLPQTVEVDVREIKRYGVTFALERAESASLSLTALPDRASYPAYAPIVVTSAIQHNGRERQSLLLDVALLDGSGRMVAYERWDSGAVLNIASGRTDRDVTLSSGNLPPGQYVVESRVFDSAGNPGGGPLLARASAPIQISETRVIESLQVVAVPKYANYLAREQAAGRVRIVNGSNVPVELALTVSLAKPDHSVVASVDRALVLAPDQRVLDLDVPLGTIVFDAAGPWPLSATAGGVSLPLRSASDTLSVLPGYRIDIEKAVAPALIAPEPRRIRIELRLQGVQQ